MFLTGAVKRKDIDEQFNEGIKLMGFIAFVMLVAGGFAQVLKDTGAVNELVDSSITLMGGAKGYRRNRNHTDWSSCNYGYWYLFRVQFLYLQYYMFRYALRSDSLRQQPSS